MTDTDKKISELAKHDQKNWKFHFFVPVHCRDDASSEFVRQGLASEPAEGHTNFSVPLGDHDGGKVMYYGASGWWPISHIRPSIDVLSTYPGSHLFVCPENSASEVAFAWGSPGTDRILGRKATFWDCAEFLGVEPTNEQPDTPTFDVGSVSAHVKKLTEALEADNQLPDGTKARIRSYLEAIENLIENSNPDKAAIVFLIDRLRKYLLYVTRIFGNVFITRSINDFIDFISGLLP